MNDLLFMISMFLGFMLPVIALAISVLIERRLEKRKQPFFWSLFSYYAMSDNIRTRVIEISGL